MICFSGEVESNQLLCKVQVGQDDFKDMTVCQALIDTGATHTCISSKMASALKLQSIGIAECFNTSGSDLANIYDIAISIPFSIGEGSREKASMHIIQALQIKGGENYDVLIGMDIITKGSLNISLHKYTFCL